MREILFRGEYVETGDWVKGFYVKLHDDRGRETHRIYPGYAETDCGDYYPDFYEVDPETVGQFTGLTDKNGKLAFEHDVIKHHFGDEIGVIRYGEYRNPFGDDNFGGHVGFYVDWVSGKNPELLRKDLGYWMKIVEILGSIHDNPELLGGEGDG